MIFRRLKEWIGVLIFDVYRYESALRKSSNSLNWLEICNRNESLSKSGTGPGVKPEWQWSSRLHATQFIPSWGRRLMEKALNHYPINIDQIDGVSPGSDSPDITFIIGHRGIERFPLLLLTIRSIQNQSTAVVEIIVVEESFNKSIEQQLPSSVRYLHLPTSTRDQPYNRSRTFNAGARLALGRLLVFHDNDLLVPACYAAELLSQLNCGFEVMNLKRFIFYLTESHTEDIINSGQISYGSPELIKQNATGGGSVAVTKSAFERVGGFDEGFVGWGGEDIEFWDRVQSLRVNNFGYLPILHLWHKPQPEKTEKRDSAALQRLERQLSIEPDIRIRQLKERIS